MECIEYYFFFVVIFKSLAVFSVEVYSLHYYETILFIKLIYQQIHGYQHCVFTLIICLSSIKQ